MTMPPRWLRLPIVLLALGLIPTTGRAQVGFDPARSPYRLITHGTYWMASAGTFGGSGGKVGAAPHDGTVFGLQVNLLADRTIQFGLGMFYGLLERRLIDPALSPADQFVGTADQRVIWGDASIHFNLTGGKTWRGLAPFVGGAIGMAFAENVPEEPADFRHGVKFHLSPLAGTRFFLSDRVYLQAEGRMHLWQIKYPRSYTTEPITDPGTPENPHAVIPTGRLGEWSASPWLQVGLAYTLRLPRVWPF
jgi:hypothetical protein